MTDMDTGRYWVGVANLGHRIYAIGGLDKNWDNILSCERYDILLNKWCDMPCCTLPDTFTNRVAFEVVRQRYVYGFGGADKKGDTPKENFERVLRLDIQKVG